MKSSAFLLRTTPTKHNAVIAAAFSDTYGRASLLIYPTRFVHPAPYCRIEFVGSIGKDDVIIAQEVEIIDSFSEIRDGADIAKSAALLCKILESCLPYRTPSSDVWQLFMAFIGELTTFSDWKVAPFLFSLHFFEQEGVSPETLFTLPSLSEETRLHMRSLLESPENTWKTTTIPMELLEAALETVGVREEKKDAKGGT